MASTIASERLSVTHDSLKKMFRALTPDGIEVGHLEYRIIENTSKKSVDFYHTYTRPEAQGKGVAAKMVHEGMRWAISAGMSVIPTCSYVSEFMKKHPQYNSAL